MKKMLRKKEEGAVMVFVALLMVVLLAFTALAIDFGTAYYQRQKLQTACDAAALAGVQYLPNTTKAETVAREYLAANFEHGVTTNVEFLDSNQKIRVTADFKSATTFGQILGSKNIDVTTRAAAGTKTITKSGGDFPYLLYSQSEGKELHLGGRCHVNGAVHSNGSVKFDAQDGQGEVSQISVADNLNYSTGKILIGEGADRKAYILYRWHPEWGSGQFQSVSASDGELDVSDLPGGIENYYLIPEGPVKSDTGSEVVHAYGTDYTLTPDYIANHTFYKGGNQVQIYPLSAYTDCMKKEKFTDWDNDEALKTIKSLKKQCEDRITTIKNGYDSATGSSTIAGYATSADKEYLGSSHSETSAVVVDLGGAIDVNVGNTEQKNSTIVFKGNSAQFMRLTGTKSKVKDLVFLSNSSSTNGIEFNSSVDMTMGNVYSNKDLKIFNNQTSNKVLINGDIYVDGDLTLKNVIVNGNIFATGNIDTEHVDINGFLGAEGDIVYKGVPSSMTSYSDTNPNALSVYSRSGNVDFIAANGNPPQTVVGIVLAMNNDGKANKGKISMHGDFKFYGNIIGDQIDSTAGSEWTAYPIKEHPAYKSLDSSVIHVEDGGSKTETTFVLVE
ncbi:pilus assembly protein TadG-related protein [uncultured Eubacterium sp.]|uniref:pilus assembly protein TadG-related protein n=1 Tax=uncultured Eubacterium sp. TaxID=165185 RepID=UPI002596F45B|nr:TadE/TadG family type IV pilus assembly protein [uncultured Eubacterium sp.]